jgi:hypothetical protein
MLLSAVSVLVVAQSISEIPDGLMNNPVYANRYTVRDKVLCTLSEIPKFMQRHHHGSFLYNMSLDLS